MRIPPSATLQCVDSSPEDIERAAQKRLFSDTKERRSRPSVEATSRAGESRAGGDGFAERCAVELIRRSEAYWRGGDRSGSLRCLLEAHDVCPGDGAFALAAADRLVQLAAHAAASWDEYAQARALYDMMLEDCVGTTRQAVLSKREEANRCAPQGKRC